jgi:hypothetical protein
MTTSHSDSWAARVAKLAIHGLKIKARSRLRDIGRLAGRKDVER